LQDGKLSVFLSLCQLLDAVSRVASLGFEKSYRETVVLMTRSYLDKVKTVVGTSDSSTLPAEAMAERVEVRFLLTYYDYCSFSFIFLSFMPSNILYSTHMPLKTANLLFFFYSLYYFQFISFLAYPNLFGIKGSVVVVVVVLLPIIPCIKFW
jgi:PI4-kinase N-terminal region